ncbi:Pas73 [Actinoplanes phage phiAsp2]|uniref:Pas73 n=1 Tax=Actinoplanes phage phiAsp2 TaxID=279303 RepID=Q6J7V8_9CAUD|nr:Pas73 [Actinoplanes phage phiAsp2]AAT36821.1 Pas73 [Actinoplanes phage phiAsp2]
MTTTNRYDPSRPEHAVTCSRLKCSGPDVPVHQAGQHLDQRSEFYDGPDTQFQALSMYVRPSAWTIVRQAPEVTAEVVDLVTYIGFLEDQATHARVDRDRGIREASTRALDCEAHGEVIKGLEDQVTGIDRSRASSEGGRLALLGFLHAVDEVLDAHTKNRLSSDLTVDKLVAALAQASKKTHAAHERAWKR